MGKLLGLWQQNAPATLLYRDLRNVTPPGDLEGDLVIPERVFGIVLFAHGSGSSRHSSRNQYVARVLQQAGLATLLMDLLTSEEEQIDLRTAHLRFDIPLLADQSDGRDGLARE